MGKLSDLQKRIGYINPSSLISSGLRFRVLEITDGMYKNEEQYIFRIEPLDREEISLQKTDKDGRPLGNETVTASVFQFKLKKGRPDGPYRSREKAVSFMRENLPYDSDGQGVYLAQEGNFVVFCDDVDDTV